MSEQRSQQTATMTTADQNQDELRAAYEANVEAGKPPYQGVRIGSLEELWWICRERDWVGDPSNFVLYPFNSEGKQFPDLRGADLHGADLTGALLSNANLSGAILERANLSKAYLSYANLSGANLSHANLRDAFLSHTNLSSANLTYANLREADLESARMDAATVLTWWYIDRATRLGDVVWNGVPLQQVDEWPKRLGEEQDIAAPTDRDQRIEDLRGAARAYRGLSIALRSQGLLIPASNYRLREQIMERKATFWSFNLLGWGFSWLLYLVAGYGERPVRAFIAYLLVLFGFACAYFALGTGQLAGFGLGTHDAISDPISALVFSVTSFHGRGFFPGGLALNDPITVLAALEAVIGLFIEITFIATFTQRFFGGK